MLLDSFAVRHDREAYIGFVRRSTDLLEQVMRADLDNAEENRRRVAAAARSGVPDAPGEAASARPVVGDADLDKPAPEQSDRA